MKGFVQGSLWGVVLGVCGLSVASLVGEQPEFAEGPAAPQLTVPALDVVVPGPAVAFDGGSDETPQFTPAAPLDEATDVAEAAPEVSTEPAALPQTADVAAAIEEPETALNPDVGSSIEAPTAPRVETALVAPEVDSDTPVVDTAPADALPTETADDAPSTAVPVQTEVAEADDSVVLADDVTTEETVADSAADAASEQTPVVEAAPEPVVVADEPSTETAEPTETSEVEVADVIVEEAPEVVVVDDQEGAASADAPVVAEDTAADQTDDTQQELAAVVTETLPQTNTAVRINRPGATAEETETEATEAPEPDAIPDDAPALLRYGVPFEQAEETALISIVLVDDGQMSDAPAAVADLGFVATVAVNALSSTSTALAEAYRAAGVEVAMEAELPDGAQPADVEVAFEAALGLVPDAAMLFSDGTGAMQDRAVTAQIMEILAADGYGFVTVQRGLSNAARAADQAGVAATTIEREIGAAGEDRRAILRALDQAAFRARQTGDAVLLGRVDADTLDALREWAADLDRETLEIAPVSAVLLRAE